MTVVVASGRFKKDLKRYRHKPETLEKLYEVVGILERGESLPKHYKGLDAARATRQKNRL